jgi:hypothetical protein
MHSSNVHEVFRMEALPMLHQYSVSGQCQYSEWESCVNTPVVGALYILWEQWVNIPVSEHS